VFRIEEGGRELLRVEVLEVEPNGEAKFRLWFYKWRETRPHQPYEDFVIIYDKKKERFIGGISVNEVDGIYEEHLVEIFQLLKKRGVRGVSLSTYGKLLIFTGVFRDVVLGRIPLKWPRAKPAAVEYLGNRKFRINSYEVEFNSDDIAKLKMPSAEEALRLAASLRRAGVYAGVVRNTVKLNRDSFFRLLVATGVALPGFASRYRCEELHVFATAGGEILLRRGTRGRLENSRRVQRKKILRLPHTERKVLEAIRSAERRPLRGWVAQLMWKIRRRIGTRRATPRRTTSSSTASTLYRFLEHAAEGVDAVEVRLEGCRIAIRASGIDIVVEFGLLKHARPPSSWLKMWDAPSCCTSRLKRWACRWKLR